MDDLINQSSAYEIDHIIPISISFNDGQSNKVLVYSHENQKKGNRTPFTYLKSENDINWSYEDYRAYCIDLFKKGFINKNHLANLIFEEDITKQQVLKGFINRNINDTRYACRVVLNTLSDFFASKDRTTKVKVINGAFTNQFRKRYVKFKKDRDLDHSHHGIDALICGYAILNLDIFNKKVYDTDYVVNMETGELITHKALQELTKDEEKALYMNLEAFTIRQYLEQATLDMKYSYRVDRKLNRGLSDQTIYSTRTQDDDVYVVRKINDIYDDKDYENFVKQLEKNNGNHFLMKKHDPKTWDKLMAIMKVYGDAKNPFKKYLEEHKEKIRKYSKKNNGPFIQELKYLDQKLGYHIDITSNYKAKNQIVLLSRKPFRCDVYQNIKTKQYTLVPITHPDFKFEKGAYILPISQYEKLLQEHQVLNKNENITHLNDNNQAFCFSLYKNECIEFGNDNEYHKVIFRAKNHNAKNYFEYLSINHITPQVRMGIKKDTTFFNKIHVDILGKEYRIKKEPLKLSFKLDK